jgi:hypothetical protein
MNHSFEINNFDNNKLSMKQSIDDKWIPSLYDVDNYSSQSYDQDFSQGILATSVFSFKSKSDNKIKCVERLHRLVNDWIFSTNDTKLLSIELVEYLNNLKCDWFYLINNCWNSGISHENNFKSDIMFLIEILSHQDMSIRRYLFAELFRTALNIYENSEDDLLYIVINCILEKITILDSDSEINNFLTLIESHTPKPYTNCYYKFIINQTLNKLTIKAKCLKIILKHVVEAWVAEHTHININNFESNIAKLLNILNIKYIDILLTEIPNYQTKYTNGNMNECVFNKLHVTYKLAIIGCTKTLTKILSSKKYDNNEFKYKSLAQIKSNDTHSNDTHSNDTHSNNTHSNDTHSNNTHSNNTHSNGLSDAYSDHIAITIYDLDYPDLELGLKKGLADNDLHDMDLESDSTYNHYNSFTSCINIIQTNIHNIIQILIGSDE